MSAPRLLIVCGEPIGARMAGPAIRAVELARAVANAGAGVTLSAPRGEGLAPLPADINHIPLANDILRRELSEHTCVLVGATLMTRFPALRRAQVPVGVDLYVPVALEVAQLFARSPRPVLSASVAEAEASLRFELMRADQVFCATDRQRDLWLGAALAIGRLGPLGAGGDLVQVVPFGVPETPPQTGPAALRGVVDGIGADDQIALWAGGLYEWFDPELVVEAVRRLLPEMPRLRLVFLGAAPPNSALHTHSAAARTCRLADDLGLTGKHVFFLEGWVPYQDRGRYLLEADIGVSAHFDTLETRYSWRTRLLDYVWAGLPTAATGGDELSERMAKAGAAVLCPPGDAEGLAAAMRLLLKGERGERPRRAEVDLARELRWSAVAAPIVDWVHHPVRTGGAAGSLQASVALWRMFAVKAASAVREEGISGVLRRARRFSDGG